MPRRGRRSQDRNHNDGNGVAVVSRSRSVTFLKVKASFSCTQENCNRTWNSIHAWNRDKEYCETCGTEARLINAKDEFLDLVTYHCACDNLWQAIHGGEEGECQECDQCEAMVAPDGPPQRRFGRHYFFRCGNMSCDENNSEWEDFSTDLQKTQRCTTCGSAGRITRMMKLKPERPWWMRNQLNGRKGRNGGGGGRGDNYSGPSTHNSNYCDICQDIIREGLGRSCRRFREILYLVTDHGNSLVSSMISDTA